MNNSNQEAPSIKRLDGRLKLVSALSAAAFAGAIVWNSMSQTDRSARANIAESVKTVPVDIDNPQRSSEQTSDVETPGAESPFVAQDKDLLGRWVLDDGIHRVIEIASDGTANMDVTFDFLTSFRYGSTLQLDLKWTLKENVMVHEIVGGSPVSGKKTLISDFGKKAYFKILSISQDEMHLVDYDDPPEEYLWKRERPAATTATSVRSNDDRE